jgi:hypothetical protein
MNPFDYVNQILQGKKQLIVDEATESEYVPFLVNRSLSYHVDCIAYANEMNRRHHLDKINSHTGKVIKREDGKVLKPEGWTPPQLEQFTS